MNVLQLEKFQCTGCGYCVYICPKNAIEMEIDEMGFVFPKVTDKCVECGKCIKECPNRSDTRELTKPLVSFAAVRSDNEKLNKSSSGGVFDSIAVTV